MTISGFFQKGTGGVQGSQRLSGAQWVVNEKPTAQTSRNGASRTVLERSILEKGTVKDETLARF
tara:strand:+ start:11093 stop:11284 length:192 start_codon:yes stop_codon:yes gene_type:complete